MTEVDKESPVFEILKGALMCLYYKNTDNLLVSLWNSKVKYFNVFDCINLVDSIAFEAGKQFHKLSLPQTIQIEKILSELKEKIREEIK